jgi:hypothetical protein
MNEKSINVLIVCDDFDRIQRWVEVLCRAGVTTTYFYGGRTNLLYVCDCRAFISTPKGQDRRKAIERHRLSDLPDAVDCVLVHSGNRMEWQNNVRTNKVFLFDTPGNPYVSGDQNAILRRTGASDFEVTDSDARQIIEYSVGEREELPECCQLRKGLELLCALAILCQGYLIVHVNPESCELELEPDEEDQSGEILLALETIGLQSVSLEKLPEQMKTNEGRAVLRKGDKHGIIGVRQAAWWQNVFGKEEDDSTTIKKLKDEWGDAPGRNQVESLINQIYSGSQTIRPFDVARAFIALHRRLSGSPNG